jgi:hypothetical protein
MAYRKQMIATLSVADLSEENNPLDIYKAVINGRLKQADADNLACEKSKPKIHVILHTTTRNELDKTLRPQIHNRLKIDPIR